MVAAAAAAASGDDDLNNNTTQTFSLQDSYQDAAAVPDSDNSQDNNDSQPNNASAGMTGGVGGAPYSNIANTTAIATAATSFSPPSSSLVVEAASTSLPMEASASVATNVPNSTTTPSTNENTMAPNSTVTTAPTSSSAPTGQQHRNNNVDTNNDAEENKVPHIRIVPHIVDVRKCLYFEVIDRDVPEGQVLKVGRFTERASQQLSRIAFKSKVVSRVHAEIWSEHEQIYIKDVKSSSGTFLNHMRLSPPNIESEKFPLNDGDILQLGVDYQGGTVDLYKCVKIRVEINRNWQKSNRNPFRQQVLKNIQDTYFKMATGKSVSIGVDKDSGYGEGGSCGEFGSENNECCICLYPMIAFQALFVAPCSHCFHFKCIKPILFTSTGLNCPLCRTYADLEASVTVDENENEAGSSDAVAGAIQSNVSPNRNYESGQQIQLIDSIVPHLSAESTNALNSDNTDLRNATGIASGSNDNGSTVDRNNNNHTGASSSPSPLLHGSVNNIVETSDSRAYSPSNTRNNGGPGSEGGPSMHTPQQQQLLSSTTSQLSTTSPNSPTVAVNDTSDIIQQAAAIESVQDSSRSQGNIADNNHHPNDAVATSGSQSPRNNSHDDEDDEEEEEDERSRDPTSRRREIDIAIATLTRRTRANSESTAATRANSNASQPTTIGGNAPSIRDGHQQRRPVTNINSLGQLLSSFQNSLINQPLLRPSISSPANATLGASNQGGIASSSSSPPPPPPPDDADNNGNNNRDNRTAAGSNNNNRPAENTPVPQPQPNRISRFLRRLSMQAPYQAPPPIEDDEDDQADSSSSSSASSRNNLQHSNLPPQATSSSRPVNASSESEQHNVGNTASTLQANRNGVPNEPTQKHQQQQRPSTARRLTRMISNRIQRSRTSLGGNSENNGSAPQVAIAIPSDAPPVPELPRNTETHPQRASTTLERRRPKTAGHLPNFSGFVRRGRSNTAEPPNDGRVDDKSSSNNNTENRLRRFSRGIVGSSHVSSPTLSKSTERNFKRGISSSSIKNTGNAVGDNNSSQQQQTTNIANRFAADFPSSSSTTTRQRPATSSVRMSIVNHSKRIFGKQKVVDLKFKNSWEKTSSPENPGGAGLPSKNYSKYNQQRPSLPAISPISTQIILPNQVTSSSSSSVPAGGPASPVYTHNNVLPSSPTSPKHAATSPASPNGVGNSSRQFGTAGVGNSGKGYEKRHMVKALANRLGPRTVSSVPTRLTDINTTNTSSGSASNEASDNNNRTPTSPIVNFFRNRSRASNNNTNGSSNAWSSQNRPAPLKVNVSTLEKNDDDEDEDIVIHTADSKKSVMSFRGPKASASTGGNMNHSNGSSKNLAITPTSATSRFSPSSLFAKRSFTGSAAAAGATSGPSSPHQPQKIPESPHAPVLPTVYQASKRSQTTPATSHGSAGQDSARHQQRTAKMPAEYPMTVGSSSTAEIVVSPRVNAIRDDRKQQTALVLSSSMSDISDVRWEDARDHFSESGDTSSQIHMSDRGSEVGGGGGGVNGSGSFTRSTALVHNNTGPSKRRSLLPNSVVPGATDNSSEYKQLEQQQPSRLSKAMVSSPESMSSTISKSGDDNSRNSNDYSSPSIGSLVGSAEQVPAINYRHLHVQANSGGKKQDYQGNPDEASSSIPGGAIATNSHNKESICQQNMPGKYAVLSVATVNVQFDKDEGFSGSGEGLYTARPTSSNCSSSSKYSNTNSTAEKHSSLIVTTPKTISEEDAVRQTTTSSQLQGHHH
ncbi:hypothetical protein H4219_002485 [Mycoemilia scoparia]|uniref:Uncharacterized protein n=1 Tax=Mycoemilia scoparia TaxID=417184 RepID=A0A9W8DUB2_9FUNG|nr:hypothetical protein H4219_002485 [Mycoemilia scoparia]